MSTRAAVVIAVVAICAMLAARSGAGEAGGRDRWEYRVLGMHEVLGEDDPVAFAFEAMGQTLAAFSAGDGAAPAAGPFRPGYLDEYEAGLDRLGAEGWELLREDEGLLLFKRRLQGA